MCVCERERVSECVRERERPRNFLFIQRDIGILNLVTVSMQLNFV